MPQNRIKLFLFIYWKSILWALLIFIGSSISGESLEKVKFIDFPYSDKIIHLGMYFVLMFLIISNRLKDLGVMNISFQNIFFLALLSILYGLFMEILQNYVFTQRSMELLDMVANTIGVILGCSLFLIKKSFAYKISKFL